VRVELQMMVGARMSPRPSRRLDALGHLAADVAGAAEGHRVLLVDRAPETKVSAIFALQARGSMAAGWTG